MAWEIVLDDVVEEWFLELCRSDQESGDLVEKAIDTLAQQGPTLNRPLADRIDGSRLHNMKELLFLFDPKRQAILLAAGDKSGQWKQWYEEAIPLAEKRYAKHLATLEVEDNG